MAMSWAMPWLARLHEAEDDWEVGRVLGIADGGVRGYGAGSFCSLKCSSLISLSVLSLLALAGGGAVLFMPLPEGWSDGWRGEWLNRLHTPLFGVVCVALRVFFRAIAGTRSRSAALAALFATLAAAVVEVVQPWFHRSADLGDLMWGVAGVAAGTLWNVASGAEARWGRMVVPMLAVAAGLLPPVAWLARVRAAALAAEARLPLLTDYAAPDGGFFWTMEPYFRPYAHQIHEHGEMVLERDGRWAASAHLDARSGDWTLYGGIEIDGTLECSEAVVLGLRVDLGERTGPRLRAGGRLEPGRQRLRIAWPGGKPLERVHQLVVFLAAGTPAARLRIHELRLVLRGEVF